jgi:hypothetical protein
MCGKRSLLEWSSSPSYMAGELGFPFEVGRPSSRSVIDLGRPPSVIAERISRSSGLLAAPPPRDKLVPQARQVFCDLDKVVQGLPGSPGLWIRSQGPLAGRQGFWQVGST